MHNVETDPAPEDLTKTDPCPWWAPITRDEDEDTLVSQRDPYPSGQESDAIPRPPRLPRELRGWRQRVRDLAARVLRMAADRVAGDGSRWRW